MVSYHVKSFYRDLKLALCGKVPWYEVQYHWSSIISDLLHPFRAFWYGLENLYAYIPIIFKDRDWDYSSLLILWEKKFRRMARHIELYGHHLDDEATVKELRVAASLCKRIREDDYLETDRVVHRAQWGQLTLGDEPGSTSMTRKVLFSFPKAHTDAEEKLAKEQFHRYMEHAEKQRAADLTYLCSLINKNLFGWWD